MAILTVGPNSSFPSIAAAMLAAGPGDTIELESGYKNEIATVTHDGMIVSGDASSTGIVLQLGTGIATFTLAGTAPINVLDAPEGNGIVGNGGNNVITVTDGADAVNGGLGTDRLIVDYRLAAGAVTGDSTSNFTDAGSSRLVTITAGTFEHFTILTGAGADTITTGAGDDVIRTGGGTGTITAGQGANSITGGSDTDTITALDGGNFIDAGDGTNTLTSGDGSDAIISGVGAATIVAGGGNDVVTVRGGAVTSNGGAGNDRLVVDYSALSSAVTGGVTGGNLLSGYTGHIADSAGNSVDFVETENFTVTTGSGFDVIITGAGNDVLNGGAGNDLLDGAGGNDTLNGGLGDDTMIGGAHNDRFVYAAGGGVDTITDFVAGTGTDDTIDLTAFTNVQTLVDVLALATQNGANTVINFGSGDTLTLNDVVRGNLADDDFLFMQAPLPAPNDFNGDGNSDILWQRESNGWVATWELDGDQRIGTHDYGALDPMRWEINGVGDFNADDNSDILWHAKDNGWVATWELDGAGNKVGAHDYGALDPARWEIAGVDDFNADGNSDILWHAKDNGWVATWELDGAGNKVGAHDYGALDPGVWQIAGTGDFNGDGNSDVLWRSASGLVKTWELDDGQKIGEHDYGALDPARWEIAGVGDFNGDGRSDILWHALDNGSAATWELDGAGNKVGAHDYGALDPARWEIAEVGDFNSDGRSDILWHAKDNGWVSTWELDGAGNHVGRDFGQLATDWHIMA